MGRGRNSDKAKTGVYNNSHKGDSDIPKGNLDSPTGD